LTRPWPAWRQENNADATPSPVLTARAIRFDASPAGGTDAEQGSVQWQRIQGGDANACAQQSHIADIESQIERLKQVKEHSIALIQLKKAVLYTVVSTQQRARTIGWHGQSAE
jgi:hypothetical protein